MARSQVDYHFRFAHPRPPTGKMAIKLHDRFFSFSAFVEKLKLFQKETSTQFTILSSEKLQETDALFQSFTYTVIRYGCKQGQLKRPPTGGLKRPKQRTFKVGCPVKLNVRLNRPKGKDAFLKITSLEMDHQNHDVSKEMFELYPEQRRFELDDTSSTVLSSRTMRTCEKREILEKRHGTAVLTQDVYNKEKRSHSSHHRPEEQKCEELIRDVVDTGGVGVVGRDENGGFLYCAYQTAKMKAILHSFPQCLIMDCTYKVNNFLYPLLTIMVVDGEGHGMPVFHAFLAKEDRYIMEKCLDVFAKQFDSTQATCFVVDKDMAEIAAIGTIFPNVPINLCHFHISQAVDRYLRKELGRGPGGVKVVHDLFMSQVYTESDDEFHVIKANISDIVPQPVIEYFQTNWWSKRHLWAACCNVNILKFHATTTNALESYHSKIKKIINEKLQFSSALHAIMTFDDTKISEADRQKLLASNCTVYDTKDQNETMKTVTCHVTRFAADLIKDQLALSDKIAYEIEIVGSDSDIQDLFNVKYKDKQYSVTANSCTCSTFGHMKLPCRHMFFLRKSLELVIFEESLVPERFKRSAIKQNVVPTEGDLHMVTVQSSGPASFRTIEGRYRKGKEVCDNIINFLAILGEQEFREKIADLEDLVDRWSGRANDSSLVNDRVDRPDVVVDNGGTGGVVNGVDARTGGIVHVTDGVVELDAITERIVDVDVVTDGVVDENIVDTAADGVVDVDAVSDGLDRVVEATGTVETVVAFDSADVIGIVGNIDTSVGLDDAMVSVTANESDTADNDSAAGGCDFSWPKMTKLLKPRGRPCTKQSFTSRSATNRGKKRCRQLPKPFQQLSSEEQSLLLVKAVSSHISIPDSLIQTSDLKSSAQFGDIVMDKGVNIALIEHCFEASAWSKVFEGVTFRRNDNLFHCGHCNEVDNMEYKMIQCEHCLLWFHFHCARYSSKRKVNTWFCDHCLL